MANDSSVGTGVLEVAFDAAQVQQAGKEQLLPAASSLAKDVASVFTAIKLIDIGKSGLSELEQAQQVTAQTAAQLRITGGAAGVTSKEIDDLGQSMLDLAGFDDEAARSAANVFLRFSNITGSGTFRRAETDAADLAITMGTDLPAAAELLGKALQDPDKAMRLLRPAIGQLTAAQQASIQTFLDQGNVIAAQGVIFDAIESKVGGAAKLFGQTLPGDLKRSQEEWKNAKAELVGGLAPAIDLGSEVTLRFSHTLQGLPEPARDLAGALVLVAGSTVALAGPASNLVNVYSRWSEHTSAVAESSRAVVTAEEAATVATATSAAASAAADEANLRRIVTNEQLSFTEEEVAVAMQARQTAALKALVSNDALIVSEEELALATQTNAGAQASLLGGLGPLAIGVAVGATALALFGDNNRAAADAARALDGADRQLSDGLQGLTRETGSVNQELGKYLDTLSGESAKLPTVFGDTVDLNSALTAMGATTADVAAKVQAGGDSFTGWVLQASAAHQITAEQTAALLDLGSRMEEQARVTIEADLAQGKLTQSEVDAAVAANTAADGTVNWAGALASLKGLLTSAASGTKGLLDAVVGLNNALKAQEERHKTQVDDTRAVFDAEQSYANAQQSTEAALRSKAQAEQGVEDALRGVEDAQRRVTDAQKALNEALKPAGEEDLGKANLDVESANLRVADSAARVRDEQEKLNQFRKDGKHNAADVADQERRVEEAQIAQQEAIFGVTDAEKRLQDVQAKGSDQDAAVISARENLAQATQGVQDAQQRLADSHQAVVDASGRVDAAYATQATSAANLKDAQHKLETGTIDATTAAKNQLTSFQDIDAFLSPGSSFRSNVEAYIGDLEHLYGIFTAPPPSKNPVDPGYGQTNLPQRASGGRVDTSFVGAERGPELLWDEAMYAPPASGHGWVSNAGDTEKWIQDVAARGAGTARGRSIHLAPGAIVVHNPKREFAGESVTRELSMLDDKLAVVS